MSVRRLAEIQPETFAFTPENEALCRKEIGKYPPGRQASAVIALLWRAQKQNGYWLPKPAIEMVARMLDMPYIRVLEIATFYTMFNLAPVGKYYIQFCGTTPCVLAGADAIKGVLAKRIGPQSHVTADGLFSWLEVECLGACCNAPMVQINDDYYEDLTPENFIKLLDDLAAGRPVKAGSQTGRISSEPTGGLTSLTSLYGIDGRSGPMTQRDRPSAPDDAAAQAEYAAQSEPPGEPAAERIDQEAKHSTGKPEGSVHGTSERADVSIADPGKAADRAAHDAATHSDMHKGEPKSDATSPDVTNKDEK
jgi:NADH-quinone oxidoreductase subunit E